MEFDPATEFQILETFDFQEEIQRPESLRFYTLEEQLLDYVEKSMPDRPTRFQLKELRRDSDRLQEAYVSVIDPDFELKPKRVQTMPSWIHPIHSDFELNSYNFEKEWNPIMEQKAPNYYPRMILGLPKPYITKDDESPLITQTTKTVDMNGVPVIALGEYKRTKTVLNEDGTINVLPVPIPNTADNVRIKGYALDSRLDIPNPIADHPFFNSGHPSQVITNEPFLDVFPSINAIMTHGVPTTTDPYVEGNKYLKLYDVKFSDISWELWRKRFPVVETVETSPPVVSVAFPKPESKIPSANLSKFYTSHFVGIDNYTWLANQEDGGAFVPRMLLSKASEAGLLSVKPIPELPEPSYPDSTPSDCLNTESFDSFNASGIFRNGKCLPVSSIQNERFQLVSTGRKAWREGTEHEILKEYQDLLRKSSNLALPTIETKYEKHDAHGIPEMRKEILLLLSDPKRLDIDKFNGIVKLVEKIIPKDRLYLDSKNAFIVCEHTIELLKEPDMQPFYREWTFIEAGYRVCKHCGQQINRDVFLSQDDFDESGHVVISHEKLPVTYHGSDLTYTLSQLRGTFELGKSVGRTVLYLLLSLFQVVPLESQLVPVLSFMDKTTAAFKGNYNEEIGGAIGIVGMSILLQTHNPMLIPRRSFGSKKLLLSGFPRDTDDAKEANVINTILFVLENTFESFPATFTGPVAIFMRGLANNRKSVRSNSIKLLSKSVEKFKTQFIEAKRRYESLPPDVQIQQLTLPSIIPKKESYKPNEFIHENSGIVSNTYHPLSYITCPLPPSISQKALPFHKVIPTNPFLIQAKETRQIKLETLATAEIQKNVKIGFPKKLKAPILNSFIESADGIAAMAMLTRLMDIFKKDMKKTVKKLQSIKLETRIHPSMLRDSARGLLFVFLNDMNEDNQRVLLDSLKSDLVLRMLLMKPEDAEKEDMGLRARERDLLKSRLRQKSDAEREVLKMLLDIGISSYIITNEDRQMMAKESEDSVIPEMDERPEGEYDNILGNDDDGDIENNENGIRGDRDFDIGMQGAEEEY